MKARKAWFADPIDGARRPADAVEAAPVTVRPRIRHDPPVRAIATAVARAMTPSPTINTSAPEGGRREVAAARDTRKKFAGTGASSQQTRKSR
jgi:hypothetical protein